VRNSSAVNGLLWFINTGFAISITQIYRITLMTTNISNTSTTFFTFVNVVITAPRFSLASLPNMWPGQFDFVPCDHLPPITVDVCGRPAGWPKDTRKEGWPAGRILVCTNKQRLCTVSKAKHNLGAGASASMLIK